MPISHVSLAVSDLDKSLEFYLAALKPLGYKHFKTFPGVVGLTATVPDFWLWDFNTKEGERNAEILSRKPDRTHLAFHGNSRSAVREFYAAALKAGATDNGPPGLRPQYADGYYAAFVYDRDGHNIEVACFSPWWYVVLKNSPYIAAAGAVALGWWAGKKGWF